MQTELPPYQGQGSPSSSSVGNPETDIYAFSTSVQEIFVGEKDRSLIESVESNILSSRDVSILADSSTSVEKLRDLKSKLEAKKNQLQDQNVDAKPEGEIKGLEKHIQSLDKLIVKLEKRKDSENILNMLLQSLVGKYPQNQTLKSLQELTGKEDDAAITKFVDTIRLSMQEEKQRVLIPYMNQSGAKIDAGDSQETIKNKVERSLEEIDQQLKEIENKPLSEDEQAEGVVKRQEQLKNQKAELKRLYNEFFGIKTLGGLLHSFETKTKLNEKIKELEKEVEPFKKEAEKITGSFWSNIGLRISKVFSSLFSKKTA